MRIIGKEELQADVKECEQMIDFINTTCRYSFMGRPKANALRSYRMKLSSMKKKLSVMA